MLEMGSGVASGGPGLPGGSGGLGLEHGVLLDELDPGSTNGWEDALNIDWWADHEVRYLLTPTPETRYQTKVYQQSVTLLIKLQEDRNVTGAMAEGGGVAVGPWRVDESHVPVLVGALTGATLLVLAMLAAVLYTCCHHQPHHHKNYSMKSDASSTPADSPGVTRAGAVTTVTTGGSSTTGTPAGNGRSRDSLVVVTAASSSGHQAKLIHDLDSECDCQSYGPEYDYQLDGLILDYSCLDGNCHHAHSGVGGCGGGVGEGGGGEGGRGGENHICGLDISLSPEDEDLKFPRSVSVTLRDRLPTKEVRESGDGASGGGEENRGGGGGDGSGEGGGGGGGSGGKKRPSSQPVQFNPCDFSPPRPAQPNAVLECDYEELPLDESYRTRSLPAWVRNKTRPLAAADDLSTVYEKGYPNWSKRNKNRMRSDAAAVIALSKSRGRLLSSASTSTASTSAMVANNVGCAVEGSSCAANHSDTDNLMDNEAVIVYDERTAL
ncbi:uncharacterized protein LOC143022413 isoform X2 [Oratosquilla oratoria]|uniref:uncharacterized protein LOC143022413 isoform X2 n=1 Tax=Oratosquilla oratoria TaxID=337810 RepID=UPI003F75E8B1